MSPAPHSSRARPTRWRSVAIGAAVASTCVLGATACGAIQVAEFTKATTTTVVVESAEGAEIVPESTTTTLRPARYTIQPGESLGSIARLFGVTIDSIMLENNIVDANTVRAGTVIVIPDPDAPVTPPWQQGDSFAINS